MFIKDSSTDACLDYIANNRLPDGVMDDVRAHMAWLEQETGKQFGGADNPLLVSVRSGSSMSMPGMMDTILNLGLNEKTLAGLIKLTGNERFGYDAVSYTHLDVYKRQLLGHPHQQPLFPGRIARSRAGQHPADQLFQHQRRLSELDDAAVLEIALHAAWFQTDVLFAQQAGRQDAGAGIGRQPVIAGIDRQHHYRFIALPIQINPDHPANPHAWLLYTSRCV